MGTPQCGHKQVVLPRNRNINSWLCHTVGLRTGDSATEWGYKQWRTQEFCSGGGGVQKIQLRTEDRENGDLGALAN